MLSPLRRRILLLPTTITTTTIHQYFDLRDQLLGLSSPLILNTASHFTTHHCHNKNHNHNHNHHDNQSQNHKHNQNQNQNPNENENNHQKQQRAKTTKRLLYGTAMFGGLTAAAFASSSMSLSDEPLKPKLVILGSGWAAVTILKELKKGQYDVVLVSPRNYFLFTPLLPSATTGTLESRSIVESIRRISLRCSAVYYEATAVGIDIENKEVICQDSLGRRFAQPYDKLVVTVGSVNNTFNTPGVEENCCFLKEVKDAKQIRQKIMNAFEIASLPSSSTEEKRRLLHFVVVGGGPTGVEFAGELYDFLKEDLKKLFPELCRDYVRVTLFQSGDHILNTYDQAISNYAEKQFRSQGIEIITGARVLKVEPNTIHYVDTKTKAVHETAFGLCVWSTGIKPSDFVSQLCAILPGQTNTKSLMTNSYNVVLGSKGNIFAAGDCATEATINLKEKSREIFNMADKDRDGVLSVSEFEALCQHALKRYPHLAEHVKRVVNDFSKYDTDHDNKITIEEFQNFLQDMDKTLKPYPATAQVAAQQGKYIANLLNYLAEHPDANIPTSVELSPHQDNSTHDISPFKYKHLGSMASLGSDHAAIDLGGGHVLEGLIAFFMWKSAYLSKQVSLRTRVLIAFDWVKKTLFGRDLSKW